MYTYPLYAMVARPKAVLLGNCRTSPGYVSDDEVAALQGMAAVRQEIMSAKKMVPKLDGLLSSQGALQQVFTLIAKLHIQHRAWHDRFLLANRHKHEDLGHLKPTSLR